VIVWKGALRPYWCKKLKLHMRFTEELNEIGNPKRCLMCGERGKRWG
jgi:hypothetical protein